MRDDQFHGELAALIRARLDDADCTEPTRGKVAASARRMADILNRGDSSFSYEWFYGACSLDRWGDLLPPFDPNVAPIVKWDPEIGDFRRISSNDD